MVLRLMPAQYEAMGRASYLQEARAVIEGARDRGEESARPALMEVFLAEYGLSTDEGISLMCLAEALLRVPDAETMDALLTLKKQGKIRAIGVSNVDAPTLQEYLRHGPVDAIQERYSLIDREIEQTLLPLCGRNNVAILGYSSLALGLLAGPIDPARQFTGDDQRASNPRFGATNRARLKAFFDELEPLRRQFGCSFGQLMIAWTLASGSVSVALCGARTRAQATENATAGALELPEEAVQRIDDAASAHLKALA